VHYRRQCCIKQEGDRSRSFTVLMARVLGLNHDQRGNFRSSGGSHRSRLRTFRTPSLSAVYTHQLLDDEARRQVGRCLDSKSPFAIPAPIRFSIHAINDMTNRSRCLFKMRQHPLDTGAGRFAEGEVSLVGPARCGSFICLVNRGWFVTSRVTGP